MKFYPTILKSIVVFGMLCGMGLQAHAQQQDQTQAQQRSRAPGPNSRKHISLDEHWKFHFGNSSDPGKDFNYGVSTIFSKSGGAPGTAIEKAFRDSLWMDLDLPHDWAVRLPFINSENFDVQSHGYKPVGGAYPETSIGWYRKHLTVARADSGARFQLQFDGVFRDAKFWLNGFYLGNNLSGYVGAAYDITDYLRFDEDNILVVRVDATQYEGWFYEGAGIYRHVWLNQFEAAHVQDGGVYISPIVEGRQAKVTVETTLINEGAAAVNATLQSLVYTRDGRQVAASREQGVKLSINGEGKIAQTLNLSNVNLWSIEQPYLYRMVTVMRIGGKEVDRVVNRFGVRTVSFDPTTGFALNGVPMKIKGTNNHQDHAGLGSALPDYLHYYRIELLKRMGSNAYRTSHHAPAPELLDACDSLGMLVLDEQRLLNSSAEYTDQFTRMIKRDRNHPSVFLWSIGNEEGWAQANSFGRRIAETLLRKQKELDPGRTSTYAADMGNTIRGVNEVIPVRGFNYRHTAVADYHRDHPNQPIIGTEMGSTVTTRGIYEKDSLRGYVPDQDITAPWWASKAEDWWKPAAANSYWMGGFVWTGFDYRGEPTPFQWPNVNSHFGLMDVCGFAKNIYYYYQSWWTDADVLHITPHWNWGTARERRGRPVDVWVNSNADSVELLLNGKSLGSQLMPRNGHLQWKVDYTPGVLEAVATKAGRRFTSRVETTGKAAEVVLTPYKTTFIADGKDVSILNFSVVDDKGREVPDADNLIQFRIAGDAKIIGVGNGDPSSHEEDQCVDGAWQRRLFNGKCQLIIQSGHTPGNIKVEATSVGLLPASTDIVAVLPGNLAIITPVHKYRLNAQQSQTRRPAKMIGADISFLPELESRGMKFSDKGVDGDAINILKSHGFNYIRLRIFNDPANDSGYSKGKGFCDLAHTLAMAKRIKAAGMQFLLDFHYSDTWADPGRQNKPLAWKGLSFDLLRDSLYEYTVRVMQALKQQGTLPDMVQVGNEINHGMVWPEGSIMNPDQLAQLVSAGVAAVKMVNPLTVIMIHVALGGQHDESAFFIDNLLKRNVHFDVIGESYYPRWHGTPEDLRYNLDELSSAYDKDVIVVEYSQYKEEVNKIAFDVRGGRGLGACIWEPLSTWEKVFEKDGRSNELLGVYDEVRGKFITDPARP